jgi:hypothetical protein
MGSQHAEASSEGRAIKLGANAKPERISSRIVTLAFGRLAWT